MQKARHWRPSLHTKAYRKGFAADAADPFLSYKCSAPMEA